MPQNLLKNGKYDIINEMTLWGALTCLRAEKTPFEPDLDHTSVGKYASVVVSRQFSVTRGFDIHQTPLN